MDRCCQTKYCKVCGKTVFTFCIVCLFHVSQLVHDTIWASHESRAGYHHHHHSVLVPHYPLHSDTLGKVSNTVSVSVSLSVSVSVHTCVCVCFCVCVCACMCVCVCTRTHTFTRLHSYLVSRNGRKRQNGRAKACIRRPFSKHQIR